MSVYPKMEDTIDRELAYGTGIPFYILTEVLLNNTHMNAEVKIKDFTIIIPDHTKRIYLKNSFSVDAREIFFNGYCETVSLFNKVNNIIILVFTGVPKNL